MKKVKSAALVAYEHCAHDPEAEFLACLNALESEAEAAAVRIAQRAMARKARELKHTMGKMS